MDVTLSPLRTGCPLSTVCATVARDPIPLLLSPEQLLLIPLQAPCQEVAVPVAAPLIPAVIF